MVICITRPIIFVQNAFWILEKSPTVHLWEAVESWDLMHIVRDLVEGQDDPMHASVITQQSVMSTLTKQAEGALNSQKPTLVDKKHINNTPFT